jgi:transcriptional regulator with XRE-family HTH domain
MSGLVGKPTFARTDLGWNIKELCRLHGITQGVLAARMGMTGNQLSRLVCGADPRLSTLIRVADALDASLDELAGREKDE